MRMIVPYTKEIVFNTKIASITSISLEYEANILDEEVAGDFIVSGDYKIHEVSINKEPFNYRIPFSITLADTIIRDSIKYDINNFTYEIVGDDTLKVDIEFLLEGEEVSPKLEEKEERIFTEPKEEVNTEQTIDDILNTSIKKEEEKENNIKDAKVIINNQINTGKGDNLILDSSNNASDSYIIYHIHIVLEGETLDTIAAKYNVSKELILEYNNISELHPKDKVLIPEILDE